MYLEVRVVSSSLGPKPTKTHYLNKSWQTSSAGRIWRITVIGEVLAVLRAPLCYCQAAHQNCEDVKAPERYFWNLEDYGPCVAEKLGGILLPQTK